MDSLVQKTFWATKKEVVDNLDNKDYKTKVGNDDYNLKNAKKNLLKIITKKIGRDEARKLYNTLIKPDVNVLSNAISRDKSKRNNILNVLNNIESSVFEGLYFNYEDESSELEESVAKRTKLRRQISDEISKK